MTDTTDPAVRRHITATYSDPVDLVWIEAARLLGLRIERSNAVFASYDGRGVLTLSESDELDADDSLAQLVFHELCHALVAGPGAWEQEDWGLSNRDGRDLVKEHACHRVQAALAARHGLRGLLAVTTEHRPYWDALPVDPLAAGDDPAIVPARQAFERAMQPPFAPVLDDALARTARIADAIHDIAPEGSLWRRAASAAPVPNENPQNYFSTPRRQDAKTQRMIPRLAPATPR